MVGEQRTCWMVGHSAKSTRRTKTIETSPSIAALGAADQSAACGSAVAGLRDAPERHTLTINNRGPNRGSRKGTAIGDAVAGGALIAMVTINKRLGNQPFLTQNVERFRGSPKQEFQQETNAPTGLEAPVTMVPLFLSFEGSEGENGAHYHCQCTTICPLGADHRKVKKSFERKDQTPFGLPQESGAPLMLILDIDMSATGVSSSCLCEPKHQSKLH